MSNQFGFKACKKCGMICQSMIESCTSIKSGTLDLCDSRSFRDITAEEFDKIKTGKINFLIKKWPDDIWPTPKN